MATSLAMALTRSVLSICLKKYGLDIFAHSLRYAPEHRLVETTFDVKYTKAHRVKVQAISASEILYIDLMLNAVEADRAQLNRYQ